MSHNQGGSPRYRNMVNQGRFYLRLSPQTNSENGVRDALKVMPGVTSLRWTGSVINVAETERFQLFPESQLILDSEVSR